MALRSHAHVTINLHDVANVGFSLCGCMARYFPSVAHGRLTTYAAVRVSSHAQRKQDVLVPYVYSSVGSANAMGSGRVGSSVYSE
jgi:hypothetical protein